MALTGGRTEVRQVFQLMVQHELPAAPACRSSPLSASKPSEAVISADTYMQQLCPAQEGGGGGDRSGHHQLCRCGAGVEGSLAVMPLDISTSSSTAAHYRPCWAMRHKLWLPRMAAEQHHQWLPLTEMERRLSELLHNRSREPSPQSSDSLAASARPSAGQRSSRCGASAMHRSLCLCSSTWLEMQQHIRAGIVRLDRGCRRGCATGNPVWPDLFPRGHLSLHSQAPAGPGCQGAGCKRFKSCHLCESSLDCLVNST